MKMPYVSVRDIAFPLVEHVMNPFGHRKLARKKQFMNTNCPGLIIQLKTHLQYQPLVSEYLHGRPTISKESKRNLITEMAVILKMLILERSQMVTKDQTAQ
jgi:hypothetical protein